MPLWVRQDGESTSSTDDIFDRQQLASFFLGWVFVISLKCMVSSSFLQYLFLRFVRRHSSNAEMSEKSDSTSLYTSQTIVRGEHSILLFLLSFFFASASISNFASLLTFSPGSSAACAFVVAWGTLTAQAARLVALAIILLELRRLGVRICEKLVFSGFLIVTTGVTFANTAIGTGTITEIDSKISLCYRRHFLPTSVTASVILFGLEGYSVIRLWSLLSPPFLQPRHQVSGLNDIRVLRGISLIILELVTLVPNAVATNVLGDSLPFSIGALFVLTAFSINPFPPPQLEIASLPPLSSTPSVYRRPTATSYQYSSRGDTHTTTDRSILSNLESPQSPPLSASASRRPHPFSFHSLMESTHDRTSGWFDITRTARSSRTDYSTAERSIKDAVVQVAKRTTKVAGTVVRPTLGRLTPPDQSEAPVPSEGFSAPSPWSETSRSKAQLLQQPITPLTPHGGRPPVYECVQENQEKRDSSTQGSTAARNKLTIIIDSPGLPTHNDGSANNTSRLSVTDGTHVDGLRLTPTYSLDSRRSYEGGYISPNSLPSTPRETVRHSGAAAMSMNKHLSMLTMSESFSGSDEHSSRGSGSSDASNEEKRSSSLRRSRSTKQNRRNTFGHSATRRGGSSKLMPAVPTPSQRSTSSSTKEASPVSQIVHFHGPPPPELMPTLIHRPETEETVQPKCIRTSDAPQLPSPVFPPLLLG